MPLDLPRTLVPTTMLLFGALSGSNANAQTLLYRFTSDLLLLTQADFDGDGLADFAKPGAPLRAYRGLDRTLLFSIPSAVNARLAGDVDGDGRTDIVADRGSASPNDLIEVFSGADGSLLYEVPTTWGYGWVGDYPGDFDADGHDDFMVGFSGSAGQTLRVVSGRDASTLHTPPFAATTGFWSFGGCGDMDADGHDDYGIMQGSDAPGGVPRITFYSGRDHTSLGSFSSNLLDYSGWLTPVGDVNGDGHADVLAGSGHLVDGASRTVLRTYPGVWLVARLSGGSDVNGDGYDDYLIESNGNGATLYSGVDGSALFTSSYSFAIDKFILGDVDGDGYAEFFWRTGSSSFDTGVYTGGYGGNPPAVRTLGQGCAGSDGSLPTCTTSGSPISGGMLGFGLRGALPNAAAVLRIATPTEVDLTPFGLPGCTMFADVDGFNLGATTDPSGNFQTSRFAIPNDPAVVGIVWAAQWVCADASANAPGLSLSSAQQLTFGG